MNTKAPDLTLQTQLDAIEQRMERLLSLIEKLATENADLKKQEKTLAQECQALRNRHDKASSQLEVLIQRLKTQPTATGA
ncbi:hypothetical protein [Thiothrix subterranea]|uniref:TIGR02449 family protein n=1 Tax=Thiothrix subterranea TaxID=2735563 RepID=A0AA51MNA2_9GAMM|nr:hypothetical protein [Thiothrix subterranea]MDQ5768004.1 hypothetical protein [Thiothrix subterranea]WML85231.1 hypothetical protein RCG00_13065 [Thiothrix subterranea]